MFEKLYGLSCVENQVLAILRENGIDVRPLYYNSAIALKDLFYAMVIQDEKPHHYHGIPRIQDELKEWGLLGIKRRRPQTMKTIRERIRSCGDGEYVLVRVTPEFTRSVLHARGFREDHFVRVAAEGKEFIVYNDIPETTVRLSAAAFGKSCCGEYLLISLRGPIDESVKERLWQRRLFKPEKQTPYLFSEADRDCVANNAQGLRNLLGVYKLMRYRMQEYYGQYVDTQFIRSAMPALEQYYAKAEYLNLRQRNAQQPLFELLCELNRLDTELMNTLAEKLTANAMQRQVDRILSDMSFLEDSPSPDMTLREDLGLDSLRLVELMVELENALTIQLEESDLDPENLLTVGDLYRLLEKYPVGSTLETKEK